ncbi:hypothetical protein GGR55DRAFT_702658 [Xylaria sp. FL0064]|nr:hypothetical protein GGR55DRAFT_702658 [Xylaria sp. FL0064]
MTWATNPLFVPGEHNEKVTTDIEASIQNNSGDIPDLTIPEGEKWAFKTPTDHLTRRQAVYLRTYHTQDAVRLFVLPNALAADAGFTLLAQFIITWIVECFIVSFHLRTGLVPPIGFLREPKNKLVRWYFFLDHKQSQDLKGFTPWLHLIFSNAIRSLILLAAFFPVVFSASIGFLTLVGTRRGADWYFDVVWAPQVFKLIFGIAVGSTCTPLMAAFWLVRCGWILKASQGAGGSQSGEGTTSP